MTATLERRAAAPSDTDRALAQMFTENTGRHFLDSGSAYGRNWERNQGREVEDFLASPEVTLDPRWGYLDVTVDAFHWLRARLEYDEERDRFFHRWVDIFDPDSYWLESMETFAALIAKRRGSWDRGELDGCVNTYNHENNLSQTLQWVMFTCPYDPDSPGLWGDGETYVLLQVHGGCDVRGGYTAPRVFRVPGGYDGACDMLDLGSYTLGHYPDRDPDQGALLPGLPGPDPHVWDNRNGEWIEYGGAFTADPWDGASPIHEDEETGERFVRCPLCETPTSLEVWSYPVG